jgi:hypothetical protein
MQSREPPNPYYVYRIPKRDFWESQFFKTLSRQNIKLKEDYKSLKKEKERKPGTKNQIFTF